MNKKNPELVILAAGMGSRYGGLKQIDSVDDEGHIIIDFSIYDAIRAGFKDITFIIKHEIEEDFKQIMNSHLYGKDVRVKYVFQQLDMLPDGFSVPDGRTKPWGTAHAIACCHGIVDAPFAVINADDYYGVNAFSAIYRFLTEEHPGEGSHYAMVGYKIKNTVTDNGTVGRGVCRVGEDSMLVDITERTKVGKDSDGIYYIEDGKRYPLDPETTVSMNLWGFSPDFITACRDGLSEFLSQNLANNPERCEYYMPSVISRLIGEGRADVKVLENTDKWYGVTYKEDKPAVMAALRKLKDEGLYPENF